VNAMRVLVMADTHLALGARLPEAVLELADRSDHVLHAGDLTTVDVLDTLAALAPVTAVCGNVDDARVATRLPQQAGLELAGVQVAMVHDAGPKERRHDRLRTHHPEAGVIVYGHTHLPELATLEDGCLIVNPGSATQRRRAPTHTVAWLELADGVVIAADIVHLD
jgi:uncharacterized protein